MNTSAETFPSLHRAIADAYVTVSERYYPGHHYRPDAPTTAADRVTRYLVEYGLLVDDAGVAKYVELPPWWGEGIEYGTVDDMFGPLCDTFMRPGLADGRYLEESGEPYWMAEAPHTSQPSAQFAMAVTETLERAVERP